MKETKKPEERVNPTIKVSPTGSDQIQTAVLSIVDSPKSP
jgi:hypothetical protein